MTRSRIAIFVAAGAFSTIAPTPPSYGDTGQLLVAQAAPVIASPPQAPAAINGQTVSCKELKDKLQSAGRVTVSSGQRDPGETFYGPDVPQCEFWQRAMFSYVSTNDGPCGAGYVCVQRVTGGH